MMQLDLMCTKCLEEIVRNGKESANGKVVLTPVSELNDSGIYEVKCSLGHISKVVIDNINFEMLFEYALNAIVDGYYRDSVSSFTASMERYFDFFIKTILRKSHLDFKIIDNSWKLISNLSERQLGAYIVLYTQEFNSAPILLNPDKEISFRNNVIHKGYVPNKDETIKYGTSILNVIETSLNKLKQKYPATVIESFNYYSYSRNADDSVEGNVNILTTIDVMHGRELHSDDTRNGDIASQIERIANSRGQGRMTFVSK